MLDPSNSNRSNNVLHLRSKSIKRCFDFWNEREITNNALNNQQCVPVGAVVDHSHRPPVAVVEPQVFQLDVVLIGLRDL